MRINEGAGAGDLDDSNFITVREDMLAVIRRAKQEAFGGCDWERRR
jgi:hypothetical protein